MNRCSHDRFTLSQTLENKRAAARRKNRLRGLALTCAVAIANIAAPASAASEPRTRLVRCGEESCLQVSGYRDNPAATVSLNGEPVAVEGKRNWQVRLPLSAVRQLAYPNAQSIEVSLVNPLTMQETSADASLPIGLLGDISQLAFVEVRAP